MPLGHSLQHVLKSMSGIRQKKLFVDASMVKLKWRVGNVTKLKY